MEIILLTIILALVCFVIGWFLIDLIENKCGSKGILSESYVTRTGVKHTAKKNRQDHIN
jgi:uncharacterized membrane protein YuzA (DUF378 family)